MCYGRTVDKLQPVLEDRGQNSRDHRASERGIRETIETCLSG